MWTNWEFKKRNAISHFATMGRIKLLHLPLYDWEKTKIDNYYISGRLHDEYAFQTNGKTIKNHNTTIEASSQANKIELTFHPPSTRFTLIVFL